MRNRPRNTIPDALRVPILSYSPAVLAWLLLAAYLLALYASLPVMPRIWRGVDALLGSHGIWAIYGATGAFLVLPPAIMAAKGVGSLRKYLVYCAFCFLLLALGALEDNPGEKIHMLQYALLGILVHYGLGQHRLRAGSESRRLLAGILFCIGAGAVDEAIQYFLPARSFTWHDVFVNGASGILTVLILAYCLPGRQVPPSGTGKGRWLHRLIWTTNRLRTNWLISGKDLRG